MLSRRIHFRPAVDTRFSVAMALRLSRRPSVFLPFALAAAVVLLAVLLSWRAEQAKAALQGRVAIQAVAEDIRSHLETRLADALAPVEGIALLIGAGGLPSPEAFEIVGAELAKREPLFISLALAPDLVIREVYPRTENLSAIGVDFRAAPVDEGAIRAFEQQQMVLAGPITLRQGGEALAVRVPYRVSQGEWTGDAGLISATIDFPGLLQEVGWTAFAERHPSVLRRLDASGVPGPAFFGDPEIHLGSALAIDLRVPGGRWRWLIDARPAAGPQAMAPALSYGLPFGFIIVLLVWLLSLNRAWSSLLAREDGLSGLPNRRALFDRLQRMVQRRDVLAGKRAVVALDLDGFKAVNDSLGHAEGDRMIARVGDALRSLSTLGVWAARRSGDEFVLLLDSAESALLNAVQRRIEALPDDTQMPGGERPGIRASMGIAVLDAADASADDWLRRADDALYEAKRARRPRLVVNT